MLLGESTFFFKAAATIRSYLGKSQQIPYKVLSLKTCCCFSPTAECYGVFAQYRFRCVLGQLGRFRKKKNLLAVGDTTYACFCCFSDFVALLHVGPTQRRPWLLTVTTVFRERAMEFWVGGDGFDSSISSHQMTNMNVWMFVKDGSWNHNLYILVVESTAIGVGILIYQKSLTSGTRCPNFAKGSAGSWKLRWVEHFFCFHQLKPPPTGQVMPMPWCTDAFTRGGGESFSAEFWVHKISLGFCVWKEVIDVSEFKNKHMDSYNTWHMFAMESY